MIQGWVIITSESLRKKFGKRKEKNLKKIQKSLHFEGGGQGQFGKSLHLDFFLDPSLSVNRDFIENYLGNNSY